MYAIRFLSWFMLSPWQAYLQVVKYVLRYIKRTLDFGILYLKNKIIKILGYVDVNWTKNPNNKKSLITYIFKLIQGLIT